MHKDIKKMTLHSMPKAKGRFITCKQLSETYIYFQWWMQNAISGNINFYGKNI